MAELVSVCWFEIKGRIRSCMLSPETLYGAYLVYKQSAAGSYGFQHQPVEVSSGIVGEGDTRNRTVYLVRPIPLRPRLLFINEAPASVDPTLVGVEYPKARADGWWEIEIGDFFNKGGDEKEVEMGVYEVKNGDWKSGILLQGMEIRPKVPNPLNG